MSLRTKATIGILLLTGALVAVVSAIAGTTTVARLREIEAVGIAADLQRTRLQVDALTEALSASNGDWANWDDAHDFVADGNQAFVTENLGPAAFDVLDVDLVAFVDHRGNVRYGIRIEDGAAEHLPVAIRDGLAPGGLLTRVPAPRTPLTGAVVADGRLYVVSVRMTQRNSDPSAASTGVVLMAREIDDPRREAIAGLVGADVTFAICATACGDTERITRTANRISITAPLVGIDGSVVARITVASSRTLYRNGIAGLQRSIVGIVAVGISAAMALTLLIGRTAIARLERLAATARTVGTSGDHSVRVSPEGKDEIATLAGAVNEMLAGLEAHAAEIEAARQDLARASEAKSRFLSRVSHEVRNPLNAILAFAQLLELDGVEGDQAVAVRNIVGGGRHIASLLDEFLDMARIEAGKIPLDLRTVSLRDIAIEALELMVPLAGERGIVLRGSGPDAPIVADPVRLRQIVLNLVSNAVKYNRDGGTVRVHVDPSGDVTRLVVRDTGQGVAPEHLDRLFIPFDRLDADRSSVAGSGVGLAVVKQLVELMNGTITVDSAVGVGTRIVVTLPSAPAASAAAPRSTPAAPDDDQALVTIG